MRRATASLVAALVGGLLLAGCSGTEPQSSATAEADSTGGKPQIALTTTCYGECSYTSPLGLPAIAVYADGTILSVDRTGTDSRPVLRTGELDQETLARLQRLAVEAGLVTGGASTLATTTSAADGSGTTFTVRLRSTLTTVEVPLLDSAEPEPERYSDPGRATRLAELDKALREAAAHAGTDLVAASYVVRATPVGTSRDAAPWPGPPLAGLPQVGEGVRCAVVTGAQRDAVAQAVDGDGFPGTYTSGGRTWQVVGRAMLPHEQNCADVAETVAAATATGKRFPGDARA